MCLSKKYIFKNIKPAVKSLFFVFALFFIFRSEVSANVKFTSNINKAYKCSMNLEFKNADEFIRIEKSKNKENSLVCYNQNLIDFLKVIINDNKIDYENYLLNTEKQLERLIDDKENSAWKFYSLSEIYLRRAVLRFLHNQYLHTGYDIYQSFQYIQKNNTLFPEFQMNNKLLGLYNVMFGLIPDDFKWVANLIGIKGSLQTGLMQLQNFVNYTKNNPAFKTEGFLIYFFTNIFLNEEILNNPNFINEIIETAGESSIVRYSVSSALLKRGKLNLAKKILFTENQPNTEIPVAHFNYVKGICKLYDNKSETEWYFNSFLNHYSGRFYKNNARLKLAWFYLLHNDSVNYKNEINKIIAVDNNILESDKQAYSEAANKTNINLTLLKSRITFDAGQYEKTLEILKKSDDFNNFNKKEKIEYFYRKARTEQKLKMYKKALENFSYVIKNGEGINDYYRSFSLFQTANVYRDLHDNNKAKEYYEKCLHESGLIYYYSFEFKVKLGLYKLYNKNNEYS